VNPKPAPPLAPLIAWMALLASGLHCAKRHANSPTDDLSIWAAILQHRAATEVKGFVVPESFNPATRQNVGLSESAINAVRVASGENFGERRLRRLLELMIKNNGTPARVPPHVIHGSPHAVLIPRMTAQMRDGALAKCSRCDWQAILDSGGAKSEILWLSRPGVLDDLALAYSETTCGENCGSGKLYLLERNQKGQWAVKRIFGVWAT
jgi:hypothetical protein